MNEVNISRYFESGTFKTQDFQLRNGTHFLFEYIEALTQSENFQYLFESLKTYKQYVCIFVLWFLIH